MILFFRTPQQSVIAVECKHDMVAADSDKLCWLFGEATPESEENCAEMAANQLVDYLLNGNIKNSVNYPAISMPRGAQHRIVVLHENVPNMIAQASSVFSAVHINIEHMMSSSKGTNGVAMFETNDNVDDEICEKISAIAGIRKVILL